MLNQDVFVKIQVLDHQGKSIKAIAREIGVSRNTVRKYLRKPDELPAYKQRKARTTKLSDYEAYLKKRVEQAKPEWIPKEKDVLIFSTGEPKGGLMRWVPYCAVF